MMTTARIAPKEKNAVIRAMNQTHGAPGGATKLRGVRTRTAAGVAVLAFVAGLMTSGEAFARAAPENFADLAERLLPAVVNISTTQRIEGRTGPELPQFPPGSPFEEFFKEFFERNQPPQGRRRATSLGSGFIIDPDGYVVTNNHVIQDADEITVITHDNRRLEATLVGRDPKTDLALLKVEAGEKLPAVRFGDSDATRVGDWIIAIGNPFGLGGTVTAGIISARGRDIKAGPYDDFLQTDASINRGNSGGPMFNTNGEVIGINTAIYSPTGNSVGIGFSIPSATAEPVINQLLDSGEVRRGWLGVHIQTVTEELAETLGLDRPRGALVASVIEGGPAEQAGVKAGDVIVQFADREVEEMRRLPRIVAETPVGRDVAVVVWRDRQETRLSVAVGELREEETVVASRPASGETTNVEIGLTLSEVTPALRERFELEENTKGVVITDVDASGPAADKDLLPGDVIVEVSQEEVDSPGDLATKVEKARSAGQKSVLLLVESKRGGLRFIALRIEKS